MKKILVPTDFSETANNAFVHALGLAKVVDAELILLHTYELPLIDNQFEVQNYEVLIASLEGSNTKKFKEEIAKLKAIATANNYEEIQISQLLVGGELINSIKEVLKKEKIDFIVMGTSGATGWKEVFLGTNTGEAIVNLSVPVLSIPKECKYANIETIGFTTRYREKDKIALRQVIEIAKSAGASVKCLYVKNTEDDGTDATIKEWNELFKNEPITFFILPNEEVSQTIADFIIHQEIDVLAMLTYKRSFFASLFTSSFTEKMSYNSEVPILALH